MVDSSALAVGIEDRLEQVLPGVHPVHFIGFGLPVPAKAPFRTSRRIKAGQGGRLTPLPAVAMRDRS